MKESTRNIAVGLTVIMGLLILAGVVFAFTGMAGFLATGYKVHVEMDSSHGVREGDWVHLKGIRIGKVTEVNFRGGDPREGVTYTLRIDEEYRLPGTTYLSVSTKGIAGSAYLNLKTDGEAIVIDGQTPDYLPKDGSVTIPGVGGSDSLIPDEVQDALETIGTLGEEIGPAMKEFAALARNLNELIGGKGATPDSPDNGEPEQGSDPDGAQEQETEAGLKKTLARLDRVLAGMESVFADEANQENLSKSLANLAEATESARGAMQEVRKVAANVQKVVDNAGQATEAVAGAAETAGDRINDLSESLLTQTENLSQLLQTLHKAAVKLESGQGTAGKMLNDADLFDNLVEATSQLDKLIKEMRGLVRTWKESGVGVKLK